MIINKSTVEEFFVGLQRHFENGLNHDPELNDMWRTVADFVVSTTSEEKYPLLSAAPELRERIGDRVVEQMQAYSYTLPNKRFEQTLECLEDDLADDRYGIYPTYACQLGNTAALWGTRNVFNTLFAGDAKPAYDGQFFFDTDHETVPGSTHANLTDAGGGGEPIIFIDASYITKPMIFQQRMAPRYWAVTDPQDPEVRNKGRFLWGADARGAFGFGLWQTAHMTKVSDLDEAAFVAIRKSMSGIVNERNQPLGIRPTHAICGITRSEEVMKLFGQRVLSTGEENYLYGAVKPVVVPFIT